MSTTHPTPMQKGARYGLVMGLYLSVIFGLQVMGQWVGGTSLIATIAIFAYPLILYRQIRKSYLDSGNRMTYGDAFAQGVITTLCGALVSCMISLIYIRVYQPDFVNDLLRYTIESYKAAGISADDPALYQLNYMMRSGEIPSSGDMCVLMSSMIVMLGTICSLAVAALAVRRVRKPTQTTPQRP